MKKRFTEEQIIGFLREADAGLRVNELWDNGPEFVGRTMQDWAAKNRVELRFIQPGKPVQNAYIESFNSRLRDECLSQHWFASLSHMRSVIVNWRDDYNHHRWDTCRRPCSPRRAAPARWRHCAINQNHYDSTHGL